MDWLRKLPGSVRCASGLEWTLWRRLPAVFAAGTLLAGLLALALHLLCDPDDASAVRQRQTLDYMLAGLLVVHWTAVFTTGIGCVVVMLMKGPGYVADALELSDSDRPRRNADEEPR